MSYIRLKNKNFKKIALVDCNSFYVSCERLFNPKINKLPVVVLSNNDGCVISRSVEAKKIGIKMGEPYFKVKHLVKSHKVQVFSSNYALYGDISRRVMYVLKKFCPTIEIYSIDEAFLDLSLIKDENLENFISELRSVILKWTGIPVSIGVANTKTLSKVANHIAKKEKIGIKSFILNNEKEIDDLLKNFPIEDIWGVGRKISKLYKSNNIKSAYDLKNASNAWIKKNTNVLGLKTVMELRGINCIDFESNSNPRKNCCVSRSFGKKVLDYDTLKESIVAYCLNAAEKIRVDRQVVKSVIVFIRNSPFDKNEKFFSRSKKVDLPIPTDDSILLTKVCIQSLKEIFLKGPRYQKAGVIFSGLSRKQKYDEGLFSYEKKEKSQNLMKAIDKTNFKFGRNMITVADTGFFNNWRMRRGHSSKIDTSSYDFLPTINIR
jgi:DNA polymerase V